MTPFAPIQHSGIFATAKTANALSSLTLQNLREGGKSLIFSELYNRFNPIVQAAADFYSVAAFFIPRFDSGKR